MSIRELIKVRATSPVMQSYRPTYCVRYTQYLAARKAGLAADSPSTGGAGK